MFLLAPANHAGVPVECSSPRPEGGRALVHRGATWRAPDGGARFDAERAPIPRRLRRFADGCADSPTVAPIPR
eukprot:7693650-Pyramimonas_sp.AAC.1